MDDNTDLQYRKGEDYERRGDYAAALALYSRLSEQNPDSAYGYFKVALAYSDLEEYDKSIEYYTKAIALDPTHDGYYANLANVYAEKKDFKIAVEMCQKALSLRSESVCTKFNLGLIFEESGFVTEAMSIYRELLVDCERDEEYSDLKEEILERLSQISIS